MNPPSGNELLVLKALEAVQPATSGTVAKQADLPIGATSTYLKRLVTKGYVLSTYIQPQEDPFRGPGTPARWIYRCSGHTQRTAEQLIAKIIGTTNEIDVSTLLGTLPAEMKGSRYLDAVYHFLATANSCAAKFTISQDEALAAMLIGLFTKIKERQ